MKPFFPTHWHEAWDSKFSCFKSKTLMEIDGEKLWWLKTTVFDG